MSPDSLPAGWEPRDTADSTDLTSVCARHARDLAELDDRDGAGPAGAGMSAGDAETGLPTVRQEVLVYADEPSAAEAFELRSDREHAVCVAAAASEQADGAQVSERSIRAVDPGELGDDTAGWALGFTVQDGDVALDATLELVTFRTDRVVSSVLLATSPAFALAGEQRETILESAALAAQEALRG